MSAARRLEQNMVITGYGNNGSYYTFDGYGSWWTDVTDFLFPAQKVVREQTAAVAQATAQQTAQTAQNIGQQQGQAAGAKAFGTAAAVAGGALLLWYVLRKRK